ncbi:hypothetical protein JCM11251_002704 [Rhodosporidiobolus azoricus]
MASRKGAAQQLQRATTRSASSQPFFPVQSSPSLPLSLSTPKPPSSLWYTARPSLSATLTSLEHTLTSTRSHLFRAGLLPSVSSSIAHDAEFHSVLPHPRARRWKPTKDMAAYLRTGTDLKSSQYNRLTQVLAHLEGLLPYARVADRLAAESSAGAFDRVNAVPALVTDPVSVATGRATRDDQAVRGQANEGLYSQLEELLARFQQQQVVSSTGVTVERVVGKARRLGSQDEEGRTMAVGRRKESGARVWIVPTSSAASTAEGGEAPLGRVLINTRPLHTYFTQPTHREAAIMPLALVDALGGFNVFALVKGGGAAAQADAVAMGLARALSEWERCEVEKGARAEGIVSWRDILKRAELIERDPRVVERKKTGQVKARKKFTWVKR